MLPPMNVYVDTENGTRHSDSSINMTASVQAAIRACFAIVTLTGVIGNILVCLVVLLNKPMKTPMNYLLVNLAISDMLLLIFFTPSFLFRDLYVHPQGLTGDLLCIFLTGESFAWMGGYASAYFLVAIAIERFHAVTKPHHFGASITKGRLKLLVCLCWLFALSWNSIGFAIKRYHKGTGFCAPMWPTENSFKIYSSLCLLVLGVIPIFTMCILYFNVVVSLWYKRDVVQVNNQESERQRRMKATKMVLTVSLVYTLSWVPELTVFTIFAFAPQYVNIEIAYPASVAMVTVNSAVNPIIYTLHGERFRFFLKRLLFRCCRKKSEAVAVPVWSATQFDNGASATHSDNNGVVQPDDVVTSSETCVTHVDNYIDKGVTKSYFEPKVKNGAAVFNNELAPTNCCATFLEKGVTSLKDDETNLNDFTQLESSVTSSDVSCADEHVTSYASGMAFTNIGADNTGQEERDSDASGIYKGVAYKNEDGATELQAMITQSQNSDDIFGKYDNDAFVSDQDDVCESNDITSVTESLDDVTQCYDVIGVTRFQDGSSDTRL